MSKILITGGAGFIGSHTTDHFIDEGHDIAIVDDFSTGDNFPSALISLFNHNLPRDLKVFNALIDKYLPDVIIHLAAQPSLLSSIKDPYGDANANIAGTIVVAEAAKRSGAHLVFASTSAVYEDTELLLSEDSSCKPSSPYGLSKLTAEKYIQMLLPEDQYAILRYGNVYGPRQLPLGENQLIPRAIRHILYGDEFEIYGDGEQKRDFIHVFDVANANYLAAIDRWSGIYNISSKESYTVNDILGYLEDQVRSEDKTRWAQPFWKRGEPRSERGDVFMNNRLAIANGWEASFSIHEGLLNTYHWWQENGKET